MAISTDHVFGPYFFEESVNQHNYLEMLKSKYYPRYVRVKGNVDYYFSQDGATPHTAKSVQAGLTELFNKKFLHKKIWPPRDLNPCDYYLWGYLKSKVYNPKVSLKL